MPDDEYPDVMRSWEAGAAERKKRARRKAWQNARPYIYMAILVAAIAANACYIIWNL